MFKGLYTALITPFKEDGRFDEGSFRKLIDFQIEQGVDGIVPCGTTGESPCLTSEETEQIIKIAVEQANKRVKVIAGTGTNCTEKTINNSKRAEALGVDGLLVVNPYYNKPTQKGLYLHFKAVADSVNIPIVVYNIKGRTAVNVETPTLVKLMNDCDNIVCVKEASGDIEQMKDVLKNMKDGFTVLSGDDGITLDLIREGGHGVISVASNLVPAKMAALVKAGLESEWEKAQSLNNELSELFRVEFIETNPIPIKTMLAMKGNCKEVFRLPMCTLEHDQNRQECQKIVDNLGK